MHIRAEKPILFSGCMLRKTRFLKSKVKNKEK